MVRINPGPPRRRGGYKTIADALAAMERPETELEIKELVARIKARVRVRLDARRLK